MKDEGKEVRDNLEKEHTIEQPSDVLIQDSSMLDSIIKRDVLNPDDGR